MDRRFFLIGFLACGAALPAAAADAPARRRPTPKSNAKPGVAERANNSVGRTTRTRTAGKVKDKATSADAKMNKLVGRRR